MIIKLGEVQKPLLSGQLDHGHKPSETRRLLRGHSEEKNSMFVAIQRSDY